VRRETLISSRLPPSLSTNRITEMLGRYRQDGVAVTDLTESNPTRVRIPYPASILQPLADPQALRYEPDPFGLDSAREAVARDSARRAVSIDPRDVILTASTSESYSWLFKLLCDPGETVLAPAPSYPLFEHLSRLEGVELTTYRLDYHGRWEIDVASMSTAPASTRAVILVSPNNPTGSFVTAREIESVMAVCRDRGWALIVDEVFSDSPLEIEQPLTDLALRSSVLAFSLGGASKMLGLPQVKLGWIIAGGPDDQRREALHALEHIADTFLSVSTPVQVAAPALLQEGASVRTAIHERVRANLDLARAVAQRYPSCQVLRTEGGWCATVRVPATRPEDILVLDLLTAERVLVHPGYFFDFPHEAFIVVSLLVEPAVFADAFERCLRLLN